METIKSDKNSKIQARKLEGKIVVSKSGKKFGELNDLIFDTTTGEIIDFTLGRPTEFIKQINLEKDSVGDYLIPFHSVIAIGDFIVISEEDVV